MFALQLMAVTILIKGSQSITLQHACHLPFLVLYCRPSKQLEVMVAGQAKILQSLTG